MNIESMKNDHFYFVKAIQIVVAEVKLYHMEFQGFLNGFTEPEFEYREKSHFHPVKISEVNICRYLYVVI